MKRNLYMVECFLTLNRANYTRVGKLWPGGKFITDFKTNPEKLTSLVSKGLSYVDVLKTFIKQRKTL